MGNNKKTILVTGSSGLIGSEVCLFFYRKGFAVKGIDNNQRAVFFGPQGDTAWNARRLSSLMSDFTQYTIDIRDREAVLKLLKTIRPDVIVHAAAQPSHDKAAAIVFDDFDTNAAGTLNLLEGARRFCISSPFIYMSTNKVYGDLPNTIKLKELKTRWEYDDPVYAQGIPESFSIDQSKHSLFGASKLAADILVQEYGRYFGMSTCCLRAGCLTGPNHAGVELHGFLNYLVKCNLEGKEYKIFGYKGKQVRDNLHAQDVAEFIFQFYRAPRSAEVYNIGGGKKNACSVIEAIAAIEKLSGKKQRYAYLEQNRIADHICYYSDLRKMQAHYPQWRIKKPLSDILKEIIQSWEKRL
ncbi:MAG: NAD-dependent epimerase/dehydratase family protein [Candidatus Omnitrophica bacterium]|nr:NAD-dependent epimerase/dehydratase family protein [Candidatus Omnitrophota bacterium]